VVQSDGIPTRARVSRDGRYAAYTVFVTGHSYKDSNMSTKTIILDIARQREAGVSGNLESYQTYKPDAQGVEQPIAVPDFNFWGVTFSADSNRFYATLRTKGENWLVEGDIAERRIRMLRKDVECPTLSPDGKRIVFKKRQSVSMWPLPNAELAMQQDNPVVEWRLHVLDLATLQDKPLAELHNVDDQAEWLDNERILYELYDPNHGAPRTNVMVVNADGSGTPQVFLANAGSPVVIGR
jgi:Tol biopolymer transport system component